MNQEERVEVRRYIPVARRRKRLLAGALGLLALVLSFRIGQITAVNGYTKAARDVARWRSQATEQRRVLQEKEQELANLERGSVVEKQVIEEVRADLRETRETVAGLEREIAFYKGLMDPGADPQGLDIRGFDLRKTTKSGQYVFRLVLQQVAKRHLLITGYATVTVLGHDAAGERSFSLHELSDDIVDEKIALRFRYFQTIEGTLTLPEGFRPQQVRLAARSAGRDAQEAEKFVKWVLTS